jgi:hypothetical protein
MHNKLFMAVVLIGCFAAPFAHADGTVGATDKCQFSYQGAIGQRSWSLADAAHQECRWNEALTNAGRQNEIQHNAYQMWRDDAPIRMTIERK